MPIKITLITSLLILGGCQIYPPTERPDYAIPVTPKNGKLVAVPPECPSPSASVTDPYDNQPMPQFGCANARNLALMVQQPGDLIHPRPIDPGRSVADVGSVRRYDNNQTRGLIWTGQESNQAATTTSSSAASALSGDITGSSTSGSASGGAGGSSALGGSLSSSTSSSTAGP
jgi:hypothetical protein